MPRRRFHELSDYEQSRMIYALYLLLAIVIFGAGLYGVFFYWTNNNAITAKEWHEQINEGTTNTYGLYSDGDTVIIRDRVLSVEIKINEYNNMTYSVIKFTSDSNYEFKVYGNYQSYVGKMVVLSFTIVSETEQIGNVKATHETIKEMDEYGILSADTITLSIYTDMIFWLAIFIGIVMGMVILWKATNLHLKFP